MKISYNWLKEYVSDIPRPEKVAELLTGCGLEVEGLEVYHSVKGGLQGVVIGEVLTCVKHPGSDHLSLTTVNTCQGEPLKIVCGAPNVAAGQKVAVAVVGTTLYFNDKEITLQKTKIRGEVSEGMICAEDELGLGTSHAGIMVLDPSAVPGTPAKDYFNVEEDFIFEIGLTPNRSDAASHIGVARDLSSVLNYQPGGDVTAASKLLVPDVSDFKVEKQGRRIDVVIEDIKGCPRYSGLTMTGITVRESPAWLKNRLSAVGLRPINNIVDITNFILLELGQPLHAFDADRIKGEKVVIKRLPDLTPFKTLDEVDRKLTGQDLMICNTEEPMCIAGVFGGIESGVMEKTTTVFLESACFDPRSIRKTARYHGLQTDASFRFERGADINITVYALKRAALMIHEIAGGEIASGIVDVYPQPFEPALVSLSYAHLDRLIGKVLDREMVSGILVSLGIKILSSSQEGLELEIPSYKVDVTREADVIEEILRIYGYNNIEFSEAIRSAIFTSPKPDPEKVKNAVSDYLCANGFAEIMNNSLTRSSYYENNPEYPSEKNVRILNPLSRELDVLRQTLLYGGLETIVYNQNRKITDCSLFEFGNCYSLVPGEKKGNDLEKYREEYHLALFMTGRQQKENWNASDRKIDLYDLKGFVNMVLVRAGMDLSSLETKNESSAILREGLACFSGNERIVTLGILSRNLLKQFDSRQDIFYSDFNWNYLFSKLKGSDKQVAELPKFPEVRRDLALLLDRSVSFAELEKLAFDTDKKLLKEVGLFDVYEGEKIGEGKKSYALWFILQDDQGTLTDEQIDKVMNRLIKVYAEKLNAIIR
ncbi:MAG: phenylalanine--tRNA ligase subunit beta [Bacteroidetes bacterium]|nr:phenylalanine--tRNA ligase subunit beta [Bacteroidota bacterium]